jgi:hypothetical protein
MASAAAFSPVSRAPTSRRRRCIGSGEERLAVVIERLETLLLEAEEDVES